MQVHVAAQYDAACLILASRYHHATASLLRTQVDALLQHRRAQYRRVALCTIVGDNIVACYEACAAVL